MSIDQKRADPLVFWEIGQIYTFVVFQIFKRRDNKGRISIPELSLYVFALPYRRTKVRADRKINIEHQDKFGPSKESSNISPRVELAVKGINHQVNVDESSHELRRRVQGMQRMKEILNMSRGVSDMNSHRDRSCNAAH